MVLLVFGNVVLRYALQLRHHGVSEEVSRWLFVWLTFLGAVVAIKEHGHLGTDMLVGAAAGLAGKKLCLVVGQLLMLYVTWLLFSRQPGAGAHQLGRRSAGHRCVDGHLLRLGRGVRRRRRRCCCCASCGAPLSGQLSDDELVMVQESEDLAQVAGAAPRRTPSPANAERAGGRPTMTVLHLPRLAARRDGAGHSDRLSRCWLSGVALMWHLDLFDAQILAQNVINGADSFPLLAVPFFMLAGEIMNVGGLSRRIVNLALTLVGHVRGGLGYVTILAALPDGGAVGLGGGRHRGAGRAAAADDGASAGHDKARCRRADRRRPASSRRSSRRRSAS